MLIFPNAGKTKNTWLIIKWFTHVFNFLKSMRPEFLNAVSDVLLWFLEMLVSVRSFWNPPNSFPVRVWAKFIFWSNFGFNLQKSSKQYSQLKKHLKGDPDTNPMAFWPKLIKKSEYSKYGQSEDHLRESNDHKTFGIFWNSDKNW